MDSILFTRELAERSELRDLAPYALHAARSRGRKHAENPDPFRTAFARDRDRIVHCGAFRRLEYKTQVVLSGVGDNYRTRLTHTLEVAQIARSLARMLRLNADLVEALSLVHDLGHPPFGHSGEHELRELMEGHGGFEHNVQALRIVDLLERPYPDFAGLNLTREIRESILKHGIDKAGVLGQEFEPCRQPWLEAQLVDLADSLAYYAHDVDDGLRFGVFATDDLESLEIWQRAGEAAAKAHPGLDGNRRLRSIQQQMLKLPIADLLRESEARLREARLGAPEEARQLTHRLISHGAEVREMQVALRRFLFENFYRADSVEETRKRGRAQLRDLFECFLQHPEHMAGWAQRRLEAGGEPEGLPRVVCDYIAGMTDRFAMQEHQRLLAGSAPGPPPPAP